MKYYGIEFIDDFLFYKSVNQGLSEKTLEGYKTAFNLLFLNQYIDAEDFETYTTINFKRLLGTFSQKNKWSTNTYNNYRKYFKSFCDYLVKNEYIKENPFNKIDVKKQEKTLPKSLNLKEIKEILKVVEKTFEGEDFLNLRNKTIFYFYMYTGCRLSELIKLRIQEIDFIKGQIRINEAKGKKDRIVPLTYDLSDHLIKYLLKKKKSRVFGENVFTSRTGKILQKRDVYEVINKVRRKLNFYFTPHMFRHTFATELVRKDIDIYKVAKILGHSNVKTTQRYLWLETKDIKESLNNISLYS